MPQVLLYNERELLQQVADGDEAAYRVLFFQYWDQIYSTALTFTKSPEISEDMAQEVFARIWVNREKLRSIENFGSYLYIIARNHIFDQLRKKVFVAEYDNYFAEYFADSTLDPARQLEFKQFDTLIQQGIDTLTPQQQMAFRLSRFRGLSHEEIAREMGLSKRTVKNHIVNAILALRKHLGDHAGHLPIYLWIVLFL